MFVPGPRALVTFALVAFLAPSVASAYPLDLVARSTKSNSCSTGTFWCPQRSKCLACPTHAAHCTSATYATECKTGFYLTKGKCVTGSKCPKGTTANAQQLACLNEAANAAPPGVSTVTVTQTVSAAPTMTKVFNSSVVVIKPVTETATATVTKTATETATSVSTKLVTSVSTITTVSTSTTTATTTTTTTATETVYDCEIFPTIFPDAPAGGDTYLP